jgi:hypothetical protein
MKIIFPPQKNYYHFTLNYAIQLPEILSHNPGVEILYNSSEYKPWLELYWDKISEISNDVYIHSGIILSKFAPEKNLIITTRKIKFLSDYIITRNKITTNPPEYFTIVDRKSLSRNFDSEFLKELKDASKSLSPFPVRVCYMEDLSPLEQIEIFRSSKYIVAVSGSSLTNIMYMQPDTKVLEIFPRSKHFSIARNKAFMYQNILCPSFGVKNHKVSAVNSGSKNPPNIKVLNIKQEIENFIKQ